jgi:hypothetical protein
VALFSALLALCFSLSAPRSFVGFLGIVRDVLETFRASCRQWICETLATQGAFANIKFTPLPDAFLGRKKIRLGEE